MLNSSLHTASTAVITHGRYSGRQPAMTAAIATFSTVTSARSGGTVATTAAGSRVVPSSMRRTRSSVGGTTGSPSVQPRAYIASMSSSRSASSTRRERSLPPANRTRSSSTRSGSTLSEPHPGRAGGRSAPRVSTAVIRRHSSRDHPTVRSTSRPPATRMSVGTVSISWCQLTPRSWSWTAGVPGGNDGSSWVYTVRSPRSASSASSGATMRHVSHSSLTTTTSPSGNVADGLGGAASRVWVAEAAVFTKCDRNGV